MRFHRCTIYHPMSITCSHVSMISKIEPLDLTLMSTSTEISHLLIAPRPPRLLALLPPRLHTTPHSSLAHESTLGSHILTSRIQNPPCRRPSRRRLRWPRARPAAHFLSALMHHRHWPWP